MDGSPVFLCKGFDTVKEHQCLEFEKRICSTCSTVMYRHCSVTELCEGTLNTLCLSCYQKLKLVGSNDSDTKDRDTLIKDIQATVYGGGYSFLSDCTMSEVQQLHNQVVINQVMMKKVPTVQYPIMGYKEFEKWKAGLLWVNLIFIAMEVLLFQNLNLKCSYPNSYHF